MTPLKPSHAGGTLRLILTVYTRLSCFCLAALLVGCGSGSAFPSPTFADASMLASNSASRPQPSSTGQTPPSPSATPKPPTPAYFSHDYAAEGGEVEHAQLSPDGGWLAVVLKGGMIDIWQLETGKRWSLPSSLDRTEIALRQNGEDLLAAVYAPLGSGQLELWRVAPGSKPELAVRLEEIEWLVVSAVFSPDADMLAVGYSGGEVLIYGIPDQQPRVRFTAHADWASVLDFSPDGVYLLTDSLSNDPTTLVWRSSDGALVATLQQDDYDPGWGFFSPDGLWVAVTSHEGSRLFRTADWSLERTFPFLAQSFSRDSLGLQVHAAGGTTEVVSIDDGEPLAVIIASNPVLLPDGSVLELKTTRGTVQVFEIETG